MTTDDRTLVRKNDHTEFFSDGDKMAEKPSDKYTRVLHDMPVLGTDDTVFILLHGNAKVPVFSFKPLLKVESY